MNSLFSYARFAFYVLALPLMATAAVSAHQYFRNSSPIQVEGIATSIGAPVSGLNESYRHHTLVVDDTGTATGRLFSVGSGGAVTPLADMKVHFIRNGAVSHLVYSNALGQFEVRGLEEGVYSFFATGTGGFAAFGVKVNRGTELVNSMDVAVLNPTFVNSKQIFDSRMFMPNAPAIAVPGETISPLPASAIPVIPIQGVAPASVPNRLDGANQVLLADGRLVGNLYNLRSGIVARGTKAYLVQNSQAVGVTEADELGRFAFDGVLPGVYEFVAFGPDGVAALSFEAVGNGASVQGPVTDSVLEATGSLELPPVRGPSSANSFVSFEPSTAPFPPSSQLDVPLTMAPDSVVIVIQIVQPVVYETYMEGPMNAAAGGYYGGGGGGFGGFGGLGDLARLAIMGWVLTELFDQIDFDDNDNNIPPQSPSI